MNASRKSYSPGKDPMASLLDGTSMQIIARIRQGIPVSCLREVSNTLDMNMAEFMAAVGMDRIRVERRTKGKRVLTVNAGNVLVRFAELYRNTLEVFGNQELASNWLKQELCILGGVSPLTERLGFGPRCPFIMGPRLAGERL